MNTVIIPVDLSETSIHAAEFGTKWLSQVPGVEIIIYHVCESEEACENRLESLQTLKNELDKENKLNISLLVERGDFVKELEKLALHRQADLIIMGINERSTMQKVFESSDSLKVAENKFCPVIIIPQNAEYRELKHVLLATDLKNTGGATPSAAIKKVLKSFNASLNIINVNSDHYIALTDEYAAEQEKLRAMFAEFNPEFFFLRLYDIDSAIEQFAKDKDIDLIITVQKEHSMVHKIFNSGHLKKLAYESTISVMAVHE